MIINMNGAKAPETPSPTLQEKTVTPETLPTVIGADEGYDGLSQVTVNPDAQLKAENIRSGKTVFGVEGSFVGEPQPSDYTASDITPCPSTTDYHAYIASPPIQVDITNNTFEDCSDEASYASRTLFDFIVVGDEAFSTSIVGTKPKTAIQKTTVTIPAYTPRFSIMIYFPQYSDYGWWDLPLGTTVNVSVSLKRRIGATQSKDYSPAIFTLEDMGVFNTTTSVSGTDNSRKIIFEFDPQPEHTATIYRSSTDQNYASEVFVAERLVIKVIS